MNPIPWGSALPVFLGTLPLLGVMVWNLVDMKTLRSEMNQLRTELRAELNQLRSEIRTELQAIRAELANIRERVATLEERDRLTRPQLTR
jgi:predicted  nucleic acid-binding Zn-ribbon protein